MIFAGLTIRAYYAGSLWQKCVFKPLAIGAIIALAVSRMESPPNNYELAMVAALTFSLIGDVLLIWKEKLFVPGLVCFLLAHFCFIYAFLYQPLERISYLTVLPYALFVGVFMFILWPALKNLKIPVLVYSVVLAAMAWLALNRYLAYFNIGAFSAFVGSLFFVASDSVLAVGKFRRPDKNLEFHILSTYFTAQWLIALSV